MSVYVAVTLLPHGRGRICHLAADASIELYDMLDAIGVEQHRVYRKGAHDELVIVSLTERNRALSTGAIALDSIDLARKLAARQRLAL